MHEMSLAEGVIRILEDQAKEQNYSAVKQVWLEIGTLSHVEPEAMRFCFDVVCKGTIADGATLTIEETPGEAWCMDCSKTVVVAERHSGCPDCGGFKVQITGGEEMRVKELEVV